MKELEISDIWTASAIVTSLKIEPKFKIRTDGMVSFVFPNSEEIYRAIADFQQDRCLPSYSFMSNFKLLKSKVMTLKQSIKERENEKA